MGHQASVNDDMDLDNSRSKPKVMGVVSPNDEEEVSSFSKMESKIQRRKGVTRQLYGRLQKHRRQNSNKQSKRTLTRSDEEISKKLEDIRRYEQTVLMRLNA